jgi:hypothetical protein
MNIQLQQAFEGAYKLPLFEQNILAEALMATIRNYELFADDEKQWNELFQSEASQQYRKNGDSSRGRNKPRRSFRF